MAKAIATFATLFLGVAAVFVFGLATSSSAHPLSTSAVLLDLGSSDVTATIELPLDQLGVAQGREFSASNVLDAATLLGLQAYVQAHMTASDPSARGWTTVISGGRVAEVDGVDTLVFDATLTPSSGPVGDFTLHYDAIVDTVISHRVFISARYGHTGTFTTLAMLSWQTGSVLVAAVLPSESQGFVSAVDLGIEHIRSGSDHLLFLLMLLLPAPLVARGKRWTTRTGPTWRRARRTGLQVVHVVTAFALGHSLTLALGAMGWVHLPVRLVESGIAVSVLVSALHAIRPIARGGEALIGFGFGLLHGLSFAALLNGMDLSPGGFVLTLLGFNLGIELTQLLVVALVMPSLLLLAQTPSYPVLRTAVASAGVALAAAWLVNRIGLVAVNPLEPISDVLVAHPFLLAGGLALIGLATHLIWQPSPRLRDGQGILHDRFSGANAKPAHARQNHLLTQTPQSSHDISSRAD